MAVCLRACAHVCVYRITVCEVVAASQRGLSSACQRDSRVAKGLPPVACRWFLSTSKGYMVATVTIFKCNQVKTHTHHTHIQTHTYTNTHAHTG